MRRSFGLNCTCSLPSGPRCCSLVRSVWRERPACLRWEWDDPGPTIGQVCMRGTGGRDNTRQQAQQVETRFRHQAPGQHLRTQVNQVVCPCARKLIKLFAPARAS
eukprot:gene8573-biopygen1608